ncbi:hypothetical protein ACGFNP_13615 [Nonomuraea sp. NPDC049269]
MADRVVHARAVRSAGDNRRVDAAAGADGLRDAVPVSSRTSQWVEVMP